jgi:hypothetical protein
VKVGDEPTLICTVPPGKSFVTLQNIGKVPIFIGGPTVSASADLLGLRLEPDTQLQLSAADPDANDLYGVASKDSGTVVFIY